MKVKRRKKPMKKIKLFELREEIKEASILAERFSSKLLTLTRFRDEIQDEVYENEIKALAVDINLLMQRLKTFLTGGLKCPRLPIKINNKTPLV
jgi:hypothetical protein